jgi:hypothetical protein
MQLSDLWDDPEEISGYNGRRYFRVATITWSKPRVWHPDDPSFRVPEGWAGHGGIYAFIRSHWSQSEENRIAYIGKANSFSKRLTRRHQHFDLVSKRGQTAVSCGRVAFTRLQNEKASSGHYLEIEDIVKFVLHEHLENTQGFESLPGFRRGQPRAMNPWVIINKGHRFGGQMPRRIMYPWIGVEF